MKAWHVKSGSEDHGDTIVFHESNAAARRIGANELNIDFEDAECIRAECYDQYAAQGHVPAKVLMEDGWHFFCWGCGDWVEDVSDTVFSGMHGVYCCQQCKDDRDALIEKTNREAWDFYVSLVNGWCKWNVPEPPRGWPVLSPDVQISFPGMKHGAHIQVRNGKMGLYVANGDREAYEAWEAAA